MKFLMHSKRFISQTVNRKHIKQKAFYKQTNKKKRGKQFTPTTQREKSLECGTTAATTTKISVHKVSVFSLSVLRI